MSDSLRKLQDAEDRQIKRKEEKANKKINQGQLPPTRHGKMAEIDYEGTLERMKAAQESRSDRPQFINSVISGLTWANTHIWDRSYTSKYAFTVGQRSKIINYVYDRFNLRAGRVSREVQSFNYAPHEDRLKSDDITVSLLSNGRSLKSTYTKYEQSVNTTSTF